MADRLVQIAQFFRFDGWLINIENSLSVSICFSGILVSVLVPHPLLCKFLFACFS